MRDSVFCETFSEAERKTWRVLKAVIANLLGNFKAENCESFVEEILDTYKVM